MLLLRSDGCVRGSRLNCWPTSSSVWSVFMPIPKRIRSTRSSRGVRDAKHAGCRFLQVFPEWRNRAAGIAFLSSMKSPSWLSSSSPIGVSNEIGSLAIFITLRTFSKGICSFSANSSGVGSRPIFVQHLTTCADQFVDRLDHVNRNTDRAPPDLRWNG